MDYNVVFNQSYYKITCNFNLNKNFLNGFIISDNKKIDLQINCYLKNENRFLTQKEILNSFNDGKWEILIGSRDNLAVIQIKNNLTRRVLAIINSTITESYKIIDIESNDDQLVGKILRLIIVSQELFNGELIYIHGSVISNMTKSRALLLIGPASSGKSTFSYIAYCKNWEVIAEDMVLIAEDVTAIKFFSSVNWECRIQKKDFDLIHKLFNTDSIPSHSIISDDVKQRIKLDVDIDYSKLNKIKLTDIVLLDNQTVQTYGKRTLLNTEWLMNEINQKNIITLLTSLFNSSKSFHIKNRMVNQLELLTKLPTTVFPRTLNVSDDFIRFSNFLDF